MPAVGATSIVRRGAEDGPGSPWMLWHYDAGAWHPWGGLGAGFNTRQAAETQRDAVWGRP
jgi:hypothetical protein